MASATAAALAVHTEVAVIVTVACSDRVEVPARSCARVCVVGGRIITESFQQGSRHGLPAACVVLSTHISWAR